MSVVSFSSKIFKFKSSDVDLLFVSEQISRDYQDFLKNAVLPEISKKFGLRIRELLALVCIDCALRPASARDLAEVMGQDPATMTRSKVTLVGKGFVTTSSSYEDSRVIVLDITPEGKSVVRCYNELLDQALKLYREEYESKLKSFDAEKLASELVAPMQKRAKTLAKISISMAR